MSRPALSRLSVSCAALLLSLTSCFGGGEDVGIRVVVAADLSGKVTSRGLVAENVRGTLSAASEGVVWEHHAQIVFSRGTFQDLRDLKLEEIEFEVTESDAGITILTVTLPRGPEMRWPAALTTADAELRSRAGATIEPDNIRSIGDKIELAIQLPKDVISQGLRLRARGVDGTHERNEATLTINAEAARAEGDPLTWIITW